MSGYRADAEQSDGAARRHPRRTRDAVGQRHLPVRRVGVPAHAAHRGVEHQVPAEVEVVGDRLQVAEDLRLIGVGTAPAPVRRERERVQVALDVARRARIDVAPPGAADTVGALDDRQIVDASAPQRHCGGESAETRPDDHHPRRPTATRAAPAVAQADSDAVTRGHRDRRRIPPVRRWPSTRRGCRRIRSGCRRRSCPDASCAFAWPSRL